MPAKFYNYQYYQSGEYVVVSFLGIKGVPEDGITVDIQQSTLKVMIKTPDYDPYEKSFILYSDIDVSGSSYKVSSIKVEIKLHKMNTITWPSLERTETVPLPTPEAASAANPGSFSTSKWDKFVKEEDEPVDTTGDNLFKVLFAGASPDQKRAMLKSIQQSHGKTLNMNWDEVKDKDFSQDE